MRGPGAGRLSAIGPALVRRLEGAVLRVADAGRRRSRDMGRRPRGRRAARLSDDERRSAPLANGSWDAERRRILGIDRGDIVVIDTVGRTRHEITRTTGNESSARWARGGTHVTFVRDNNLFIVPVDGRRAGTLVQLTDVAPRRTEPRLTDSQRVRRRRRAEAARLGRAGGRAAQAARGARPRARAAEVRAGRAAERLSTPRCLPTRPTRFWSSADRAQARAAQVPRFVSESAYTEEIASPHQGRRCAGSRDGWRS